MQVPDFFYMAELTLYVLELLKCSEINC